MHAAGAVLNNMKFTGNTVLITGGAQGIGYAMAEYLAESGNTIIICDRNEAKLEEVKQVHPEFITYPCDISDAESRTSFAEKLSAEHPELNFLINNAGIQRNIDLTKGTEDLWMGDMEIEINLRGTIYMTALLLPLLRQNENSKILNICSGLAFAADRFPELPVYSATKAGIHAYTRSERVQLAPLNIRVMEIIPPMVDTGLNPVHKAMLQAQDPKYSDPNVVPPPEVYVRRTFAKLEDGENEVKY